MEQNVLPPNLCVCMCVRVCMRACVRACVRACRGKHLWRGAVGPISLAFRGHICHARERLGKPRRRDAVFRQGWNILEAFVCYTGIKNAHGIEIDDIYAAVRIAQCKKIMKKKIEN